MKMLKLVSTAIAVGLMSFGVQSQETISGPELVVTPTRGGINIDYVNDSSSEITALMYSIDIGEAEEGQVDLSECVAGLPKTHIGFCKYNPGVVKVVIYSGSNAPLQVANIGSIKVAGKVYDRRTREGNLEFRRDVQRADGSSSILVKDAVFSRTDGTDVSGTIHQ